MTVVHKSIGFARHENVSKLKSFMFAAFGAARKSGIQIDGEQMFMTNVASFAADVPDSIDTWKFLRAIYILYYSNWFRFGFLCKHRHDISFPSLHPKSSLQHRAVRRTNRKCSIWELLDIWTRNRLVSERAGGRREKLFSQNGFKSLEGAK